MKDLNSYINSNIKEINDYFNNQNIGCRFDVLASNAYGETKMARFSSHKDNRFYFIILYLDREYDWRYVWDSDKREWCLSLLEVAIQLDEPFIKEEELSINFDRVRCSLEGIVKEESIRDIIE